MPWCEACQDHFPRDHYTEDGMRHKVGRAYGPVGQQMLRQETAILTLARAERDLTEALSHGCNPGVIRAIRDDMRGSMAQIRPSTSSARLAKAAHRLDMAADPVLDSGRGK